MKGRRCGKMEIYANWNYRVLYNPTINMIIYKKKVLQFIYTKCIYFMKMVCVYTVPHNFNNYFFFFVTHVSFDNFSNEAYMNNSSVYKTKILVL